MLTDTKLRRVLGCVLRNTYRIQRGSCDLLSVDKDNLKDGGVLIGPDANMYRRKTIN